MFGKNVEEMQTFWIEILGITKTKRNWEKREEKQWKKLEN